MSSTNNDTSKHYILITGGSGLVGNELIHQLLQKGKKIKALVNKSPLQITHKNLIPIQCDLFDVIGLEEALEEVDEVYHCAGFISYSSHNKSQLYKINVEGTANMVNAAVIANVRKFVHVSSIAALGKFVEGKPIDETMSWTEDAKNSTYGHSKYLGEMEVWRGIGEGLDAVIVNPVIILGGGSWHTGSTSIFKSAYNRFPWYTTGVSGFVDVKDVSNAMTLLMNSDIKAQRFIISGHNTPYRTIFNLIADAFKVPRPSKKVTPLLAAIVWRIEAVKTFFTGSSPLLTKETTLTAQAAVYFDNSKLLKALPDFSYTPLEETINRVAEELRVKYKLKG